MTPFPQVKSVTKLSALVDSLQKQLSTSGKKTPNASPDSARRLVTIDNLVRYELFYNFANYELRLVRLLSQLKIMSAKPRQTAFSGKIRVISTVISCNQGDLVS